MIREGASFRAKSEKRGQEASRGLKRDHPPGPEMLPSEWVFGLTKPSQPVSTITNLKNRHDLMKAELIPDPDESSFTGAGECPQTVLFEE